MKTKQMAKRATNAITALAAESLKTATTTAAAATTTTASAAAAAAEAITNMYCIHIILYTSCSCWTTSMAKSQAHRIIR